MSKGTGLTVLVGSFVRVPFLCHIFRGCCEDLRLCAGIVQAQSIFRMNVAVPADRSRSTEVVLTILCE